MLAQTTAEEVERGAVLKRFTQLGALKLERDVRLLSSGVCELAASPLPVRAMFSRLLQIATLLSVGVVEEAHDVWDALKRDQGANAAALGSRRPREPLSSKEAKRVLGLRTDFDPKLIQGIKL
jgi:hypothetical protein